MTLIPVAKTAAGAVLGIPIAVANRHGLVTGATGSGKTVTLQKLAEGFSRAGVPVFAADIKGDLSGLAKAGSGHGPFADRATALAAPRQPTGFPVRLWDIYAEDGLPFGSSVEELGPMFMARLLELNQTQEGAFNLLMQREADHGHHIRDLGDLRATLALAGDDLDGIKAEYGHVAVATLGAIQRQILVLNAENGWRLFREPRLDLADLMAVDEYGRGVISLLTADRLTGAPRLYATWLLALLNRLFEELPEVGDLPKPKLVFFFDEAHLLFATATPKLLEAIERLVRLIRSKGVGVYFVTQSPRDIPEPVLAQLGHRIQHALRAFTPRDHKMIRAVADSFRPNPALNIPETVMSLAVGECLISTLGEDGVPSMVEKARVLPPDAHVGPLSDDERKAVLLSQPGLARKYAVELDERAQYLAFLSRVAPHKVAGAEAAYAAADRARAIEEQAEAFDREAEEIEKLGFFARWRARNDLNRRRDAWLSAMNISA